MTKMIMKKTLKLLAALALIMFVGCTKELVDDSANQAGSEVENPEVKPDEEPVANTTVTIDLPSDESAVVPSGVSVKTTLGALEDGVRKIYWCEDDKISINGNASKLMTDLSDDKRSATFEFADAVLEYPYSVLYPAEMYKDEQTITLLSVQPSADDSFADDAAPMAAYQASAGKITLKHLVGVVRLQIKLPAESTHGEHALNRVEFRGNNSEQVSGDFTINYEDAKIASASTAEADQKVVAMVEKTLSSEANTDVFIVVPAMQYAQGFTVRLVDGAGHYMDISTEDITIAAGEVKRMPVVEFAPKGTLVDVEIKSAADLVAFAKEYNAGAYADEENLNVRLTSDIVFDDETNAAWEPIGTSGNWFKGAFDGCNFSIKDFKSSRPLFYGTDSESYIENLKIDGSCVLTADYVGELYYGGFVGLHNGVLYNCHNSATVTLSGTWGEGSKAYVNVGGLVGRIASNGKVDNCYMDGDIETDETFYAPSTIYLGGISGCIAAKDGKILSSHFTGSVTTDGSSANGTTNYIGGITGLAGGEVYDCSTAAGEIVSAEYESTSVVTRYLGGIVGYVKDDGRINKCTNNSSVSYNCPKPGESGTSYTYIGGVAGAISGNVLMTDCKNDNTIHSICDYSRIYLGGIVGQASAGTSVDNCHNLAAGEVKATTTTSAGYLYMGGVVGGSATSSVSNISNAAQVKTENVKATAANIGGCVGFLEASLIGVNAEIPTIPTITNSGAVTAAGESTLSSYFAQGGVVGTIYKADATVSYVKNTGNVTDAVTVVHSNAFSGGVVGYIRTSSTVSNVTNGVQNDTDKGIVTFTSSEVQTHINTCLGGVVGAIDAGCVGTVQNSINYGEVSRVATTEAVAGSGMVCGGVVGILKGSGSIVDNCENHGYVINNGLNTSKYDSDFDPATSGKNSQAAGGIVGFALGNAINTAVQITGCTNFAECSSVRGYVGGVAGYIRNAVISGSHHKNADIYGGEDYTRVGGIVGCISDASSIKLCSVSNATIDGVKNGNVGGIAGGFADKTTATIEESTVDATILNSKKQTRTGSIVGNSYAGLTITDCGVKGTVQGKQIIESNLYLDFNNKATIKGCYLLQ